MTWRCHQTSNMQMLSCMCLAKSKNEQTPSNAAHSQRRSTAKGLRGTPPPDPTHAGRGVQAEGVPGARPGGPPPCGQGGVAAFETNPLDGARVRTQRLRGHVVDLALV